MRTTIQLDNDVLVAARVLPRQRHSSLGDVISDLARQALSMPAAGGLQVDLEERSDCRNCP